MIATFIDVIVDNIQQNNQRNIRIDNLNDGYIESS